ncbi:MAG: hypothetical protein ACYCW6_04695 [Candidatus Xenobia bacterium]
MGVFFFAHLGGGSQMVLPWRPRTPLKPLLLGTVLPDLVDKPLYYLATWLCGKHSAATRFLGCTRNLGHTALFLLLWLAVGWKTRSEGCLAVALGVATHDLLDWVEDFICFSHDPSSEMLAFFFPFTGHFGHYGPPNAVAHLLTAFNPFRLTTELIGLALLVLLWQQRQRAARKMGTGKRTA